MVQISSTIKNVTAADLTGQKFARIQDVGRHLSVGEMLEAVLPRLRLTQMDTAGNQVGYEVLLERTAQHLHRSQIVGDVLVESDHLVVHPRVHAGGKSA